MPSEAEKTTGAAELLAYQDEFSRAYLEASSSFPLQVDLPVIRILHPLFLSVVQDLRAGRALSPKQEEVLRDSTASLVEKFEQHYQQVQERKAKDLGLQLPLRVMTRGEKEHLQMFLQYLVIQDALAHMTGARSKLLETLSSG